MNVFIIGSGNIASHLSQALMKNSIAISGIYSRNEKEGLSIADKVKSQWFSKVKSIPVDADIYLICVSDDAIEKVVEQLPKSIKKTKVIAHTSGSKSMKETLNTCANRGVFYPLQTFTKGQKMTYKDIPFCINGVNENTINKLINLGHSISSSVQLINDEQRKKIHLSAVMINNFVNHLIYVSQDLLEKNNIDSNILQPLLMETIKKQKVLGAYAAQTGPARRSDTKTLVAHLDLLKRKQVYKAIYTTISKSIQKTYKSEK